MDAKSTDSTLVTAARAIGKAAGRIASLTGAAATANERAQLNLYAAEYIGGGTFIIHKPKRKKAKLRQSRLKGTTRGSRK